MQFRIFENKRNLDQVLLLIIFLFIMKVKKLKYCIIIVPAYAVKRLIRAFINKSLKYSVEEIYYQ